MYRAIMFAAHSTCCLIVSAGFTTVHMCLLLNKIDDDVKFSLNWSNYTSMAVVTTKTFWQRKKNSNAKFVSVFKASTAHIPEKYSFEGPIALPSFTNISKINWTPRFIEENEENIGMVFSQCHTKLCWGLRLVCNRGHEGFSKLSQNIHRNCSQFPHMGRRCSQYCHLNF